MPNYQVDALRTIRSLEAAHARAGHTAQAEQMRQVADQVAQLVEVAETVLAASPFEMPTVLVEKARAALRRGGPHERLPF